MKRLSSLTVMRVTAFWLCLASLGLDALLTRSEMEVLFDHMACSSREYGINAVDFCHFLKTSAITLEPKLAALQRKVVSRLAKQQDVEDELVQDAPVVEQPVGALLSIDTQGA